MKKLLVLAVVALSGIAVGVGSAAQPASPGCFGQDRAATIHVITGQVWGDIASDRAGTNGDQNRAYRASASCGSLSD